MMARGTSQACSHRSQELYFRVSQVLKETIKNYEDEQGVQYGENAFGLCSRGTAHSDLYTPPKGATGGPRLTTAGVGPRGRRQNPSQGS